MEVELDVVRSKIHTLLLNCNCAVIRVSAIPALEDDDVTVRGRIQASCHPKTRPDRTVEIMVMIHDQWSSVSIYDLDTATEIRDHQKFRGDNAIEQVVAFIKNTLLEL